jgi:hypothetical protein
MDASWRETNDRHIVATPVIGVICLVEGVRLRRWLVSFPVFS